MKTLPHYCVICRGGSIEDAPCPDDKPEPVGVPTIPVFSLDSGKVEEKPIQAVAPVAPKVKKATVNKAFKSFAFNLDDFIDLDC